MTEAEKFFNLGLQYYNGDGVDEDFKKTDEYFEKAYNSGYELNKIVEFYIDSVIDEYHDPIPLKWFKRAAERGNTEILTKIIDILLDGDFKNNKDDNKRVEEAYKYTNMAVENGCDLKQLFIDLVYPDDYSNEDWFQNNTQIYRWSKLCEKFGYGHYEIGELFEENDGLQIACKWFELAWKDGNTEALAKLANTYYDSNDFEKAFEYNSLLAEQGNVDAMETLAWQYKDGEGTVQNYEKAFYWYQKAANLGSAYGMSCLGHAYYEGWSVEINKDTAVKWFIKSIENDEDLAEEIFDIYEEDKEIIIPILTYFADKGDEDAKNRLKEMQEQGK